jgi:hypothetical protein
MNKLINLIILFIFLHKLIPLLKLKDKIENIHLINLIIALIIYIVQLIYYIVIGFLNKKNTTLKNKINNSVFKAVIVLGGIYLFDEISDIFPNVESNELSRNLFITLLIAFFSIFKYLITP